MRDDLLTAIDSLGRRFAEEVVSLKDPNEVLRVKACYLGKKGHLSAVLERLSQLSKEERPEIGKRANLLKGKIEQECQRLLDDLKGSLLARKASEEKIDVTLPGRSIPLGSAHPIRQVAEEVEAIFVGLGFEVCEGSDTESDYYNFEALNIPADHPARDMQDTFYLGAPSVSAPLLLRTHTSPVQIHVMEKRKKPPIQMIAPGAVYRRDMDLSHTPMFHQVEGLLVDNGIRFSDLKGVLTLFVRRFFGPSVKVRFRPSYFPFTEPSAEVDIQCILCSGLGCRVCKNGGWLEVVGCGMVASAVFENCGFDSKTVSGFAFGMGIERMAMLKFGINDIRLFYGSDLRFLRQF